METTSQHETGHLSLEQQLSSLIRRMILESLAEMQATAVSAKAEQPVAATCADYDLKERVDALVATIREKDDEIAVLKQQLREQKGSADSEQMIAELKQQLEQAKTAAPVDNSDMEKILWNEILDIPELEPYAAEWKANLISASPDPVLVCMVTNLAVWKATHAYKLTLEDSQDSSYDNSASRALHNFSRYFFKALYARNTDCGKAADLAELLANNLNEKLRQDAAPYRIELTELGNTFSSRNMEISEDGASSGCVDALCSWAITNAAGNIYKDKILVRLI